MRCEVNVTSLPTDPRASVTSTRRQYEVTLAVSGVADATGRTGTRIRVTEAVLIFRERSVSGLFASLRGPVIRKDGTLSTARTGVVDVSHGDVAWPDWLDDMVVRFAPAWHWYRGEQR